MTTNTNGLLTKLGEYTQHSLCHPVHFICGEGILYNSVYNVSTHLDKPEQKLPSTAAKIPIIGLLPACLGVLAAVVELIASPIIILACLPFCWTETGRAGLRMGAESLLSGCVMPLAYLGVVLFGNTLGWIDCCCCSDPSHRESPFNFDAFMHASKQPL